MIIPLLLWFVLLYYRAKAVIHTEILQTGEMGVEQLDAFVGTPVVTFFVVAMGGNDFDEENYVLSFGEPNSEGGCGQSLTGICGANVSETVGWESIMGHYPTPESPEALYIRRSFNLLDDEECSGAGIVRIQEGSLVTVEGSLTLSSFTECSDGEVVFREMKVYPFFISYNQETQELTGLSYDLVKFSYVTSVQRIIPSPEYFLIFEIEVITEAVLQYELSSDDNTTVTPAFLSNPVVKYSSGMGSDLITTEFSGCVEKTGSVCTQLIYVFAKNRFNVNWETNFTGYLEISSTIYQELDNFTSSVLLTAEFNVDPKVELGSRPRNYDVFITTESGFYDPVKLYIGDNSSAISLNSTVCVNVLRLDQQRLNVHSVILYSEDPNDAANTYVTALYVPGRVALGVLHSDTEWSAKFCFTMSTLTIVNQLGLVPYFLQVDYGDSADLQFDFGEPVETPTSMQVTLSGESYYADVTTGLFKLQIQKRNLFPQTESSNINPNDEISDPQTLYYTCPYYNQCYHHGYCLPCHGWDTDEVSTGAWIFFGLLMAVAVIVLIALCYNTGGSSYSSKVSEK